MNASYNPNIEDGSSREQAHATNVASRKLAETTQSAEQQMHETISAVAGTAEQQKRSGGEQLASIAHAIEAAARELERPVPEAARFARDAAAKVENVSKALRESSFEDLVNELNRFARSQPATVFIGALLAGFAVSRLLKSSGDGHGSESRTNL
jgi:hypothetical protein